jgi:hypothetical protein
MMTTVINVSRTPVSRRIEVTVRPAEVPAERSAMVNGLPGILARLRDLRDLMDRQWPKEASPDVLVNLVQAGHRITLKPDTALDELAGLQKNAAALADAIAKMELAPQVKAQAMVYLKAVQAP